MYIISQIIINIIQITIRTILIILPIQIEMALTHMLTLMAIHMVTMHIQEKVRL